MTAADAAFAHAANAAATAFAAIPACVAYRLRLHSDRGGTPRDETLHLAYRGSGASEAAPPALPPALDALAEWAFALDTSSERIVMRVSYERPKRYTLPTPGPGVDVVVPSIAGYLVAYAGDDDAHIHLTPATAEVRDFARQPDHFVYRDVFVDRITSLPRRVVLVAPLETLTLEYGTQAGPWLLSHVRYDAAERHGHAAIGHFTVDASYDDYAFPSGDAADSGCSAYPG